jgi:hypothetical protein
LTRSKAQAATQSLLPVSKFGDDKHRRSNQFLNPNQSTEQMINSREPSVAAMVLDCCYFKSGILKKDIRDGQVKLAEPSSLARRENHASEHIAFVIKVLGKLQLYWRGLEI